jgi:hypothetical protein
MLDTLKRGVSAGYLIGLSACTLIEETLLLLKEEEK